METNETINIINIQRFSIYDGSGIRTTIFLKGCTLKCVWCHNPESISLKPQIQYLSDKCIHCNYCKNACDKIINTNELLPIFKEYPFIDDYCNTCKKCINSCPTESLFSAQTAYTTEELFSIIKRDNEFYKKSNGGVTFSGGEPLIQAKKLLPLLKLLKDDNIDIAIETAGNISYDNFSLINEYVTTYLFDIKLIDNDLHKKYTKSDNIIILENFKKLYNDKKNIIVRIPIMPNVNDTDNQINNFIEFLKYYPDVEYIELMPYHNLGEHKYKTLNMEYTFNYENYSEEKLLIIKKKFAELKIC